MSFLPIKAIEINKINNNAIIMATNFNIRPAIREKV